MQAETGHSAGEGEKEVQVSRDKDGGSPGFWQSCSCQPLCRDRPSRSPFQTKGWGDSGMGTRPSSLPWTHQRTHRASQYWHGELPAGHAAPVGCQESFPCLWSNHQARGRALCATKLAPRPLAKPAAWQIHCHCPGCDSPKPPCLPNSRSRPQHCSTVLSPRTPQQQWWGCALCQCSDLR